ncbi:DedA family protein [Ramlibacter sp.]|uniref:DedA family protein n=1 Tax=Ramlibacter sp. TaxID=1917967 RepID=UPI002FCBD1DA
MALLHSLQGAPAYLLLFGVLVGSGVGLPVNEDLLLVGAAALTLRHVMEPVPLVAVAWCGVLCADGLIFHWGRRFGPQLLRHRLTAKALPPRRVDAMQRALQRWGPAYIFVVRFMPGVRTALLFAAGSMQVRYRHFFLFDGAAALVELPLLVWAVRQVGGRWEEILALVQRWQGILLPLVLALAVGAWLAVRWRSRRRGG